MMNFKHCALWFATLLLCSHAAIASEQAVARLHLAGDSTMADKHPKDFPETGWGTPFATFFGDALQVINYAQNGRSTRSFRDEGLWDQLLAAVQPGDWVIIQFGHNDEAEHKRERYAPPAQFEANLSQFIREVRARSATPILATPVTRRKFAGAAIVETHPHYSDRVIKVAQANAVTLLDMDTITRTWFSAQGQAASRLRFMHLAPDLHPNYPKGVSDNTHFNELGAREVAQLVLAELRRQQHPLTQYLRTPDPKHLQLEYTPGK